MPEGFFDRFHTFLEFPIFLFAVVWANREEDQVVRVPIAWVRAAPTRARGRSTTDPSTLPSQPFQRGWRERPWSTLSLHQVCSLAIFFCFMNMPAMFFRKAFTRLLSRLYLSMTRICEKIPCLSKIWLDLLQFTITQVWIEPRKNTASDHTCSYQLPDPQPTSTLEADQLARPTWTVRWTATGLLTYWYTPLPRHLPVRS